MFQSSYGQPQYTNISGVCNLRTEQCPCIFTRFLRTESIPRYVCSTYIFLSSTYNDFTSFFFSIFTTLSVCYSKESRRWLSKRFLSVIWQKCRQITILSINISIWLVIMLKITPDCQQQVAWGVIYFLITKKSQILLGKGHRASTFII